MFNLMQNVVSMNSFGTSLTVRAHLVVLKFPSDHSECVVDEVVVYVHLQHSVSISKV